MLRLTSPVCFQPKMVQYYTLTELTTKFRSGWVRKKISLNGGGKKTEQALIPTTMLSKVAPPSLLKFLSCGCKKGCSGGGCTCVKADLRCSALRKFCSGVSCHNVAELQIGEEEDDVNNQVVIFQDESYNFEPPTKRSK